MLKSGSDLNVFCRKLPAVWNFHEFLKNVHAVRTFSRRISKYICKSHKIFKTEIKTSSSTQLRICRRSLLFVLAILRCHARFITITSLSHQTHASFDRARLLSPNLYTTPTQRDRSPSAYNTLCDVNMARHACGNYVFRSENFTDILTTLHPA